MKTRLLSFLISLILLFFFAGASTFAQNKPDKKDTKTEKQVVQKVDKEGTNNTSTNISTDKNTTNTMTSKDKMNEMKRPRHRLHHALTNDTNEKAYRAPIKEDDSNKGK